MSGWLCGTVNFTAILFLILALLVAVAETFLVLWAKWAALHPKSITHTNLREAGGNMTAVLEALAKGLGALKDLPAWVAIFLAAMALVWTATYAPGLCT